MFTRLYWTMTYEILPQTECLLKKGDPKTALVRSVRGLPVSFGHMPYTTNAIAIGIP